MDTIPDNIVEIITDPNSSSEDFRDAIEEELTYWFEEEVEVERYSKIITLLAQHNRGDLLKSFVSLVQDINPDEGEYPATTLLLSGPLRDTALDFFADNWEIDHYDTLAGLYKIEDDLVIYRVTMAVDRIFPDPHPDNFPVLLEHYKTNNDDPSRFFLDYLNDKIAKTTTAAAPKPVWIIPTQPLPTQSELEKRLQPPPRSTYRSQGTTADVEWLFTNNYVNPDARLQSADQVAMLLRRELAQLTPKQRTARCRWFENNTREMLLALDPTAFGIYGPCHRQPAAINLNSRHSDPCRRWGGCRMLTCYENENVIADSLTDEPIYTDERAYILEWYKGKCDKCGKTITAKHYAVRLPLAIGGWEGCYCSWKCVKDDVPIDDRVLHALIDNYAQLTKDVGIYDRR